MSSTSPPTTHRWTRSWTCASHNRVSALGTCARAVSICVLMEQVLRLRVRVLLMRVTSAGYCEKHDDKNRKKLIQPGADSSQSMPCGIQAMQVFIACDVFSIQIVENRSILTVQYKLCGRRNIHLALTSGLNTPFVSPRLNAFKNSTTNRMS